MPRLSCLICKHDFATTEDLDVYRRSQHGLLRFQLGDMHHEIRGNPNGKSECPCSYHPHTTIYGSHQDLIEHVKKVRVWYTNPPPVSCRTLLSEWKLTLH